MTDHTEAVAAVVLEHMLTGPAPGQCRCGWGPQPENLGKSHAAHVAYALNTQGLLTPAALSEVDADELARLIGEHTGCAAPDEVADELLSRYLVTRREVS